MLGAHVVVASRNAPELDEVVLAIKRQRGRALAYAADRAQGRPLGAKDPATSQIPILEHAFGWRWAFAFLAPGPALGAVAMLRLRSSPEAASIAAGRG